MEHDHHMKLLQYSAQGSGETTYEYLALQCAFKRTVAALLQSVQILWLSCATEGKIRTYLYVLYV